MKPIAREVLIATAAAVIVYFLREAIQSETDDGDEGDEGESESGTGSPDDAQT